jgi:hypothetical protein
MTVAQLRAGMGNDEFLRWQMYYARIAQRAELERLMGRRGAGHAGKW